MRYILPYLISFFIGCLLLRIIFYKDKEIPSGFFFFLSTGIGLGITAHITFYSYVLFDGLNRGFILLVHILLLLLLILINLPSLEMRKISFSQWKTKNLKELSIIILLAIAFIPLWIQANFYPFGGWDAWSCWNLKAKFLFLEGHDWKNMFSPILWRSSPHYPLLLPLLNVWGWILLKDPTYVIPLLNSIIFTLLTMGLLFCGLKIFTKSLPSILGVLLVLTLPFFTKLATSQYSDIVVAYFLLGGLLCLVLAYRRNKKSFLLLAGLFLGFLGFTKGEGMIATIILTLIVLFYFVSLRKRRNHIPKDFIFYFFAGLFLASWPTVLFQLLYAPANQTFINGFVSSTHPSNFYRLKIIMSFFLIEIINIKWNGIWILLLIGLSLAKERCFKKEAKIFFLFLIFYLPVVFFYYFLNTYFDIEWWLSVTLNRILFSLLPVVIFWTFYSLWETKDSG